MMQELRPTWTRYGDAIVMMKRTVPVQNPEGRYRPSHLVHGRNHEKKQPEAKTVERLAEVA